MTGYTPVFSKIVDSSLWCESDVVVKVFLTMLAKKDSDNVVRGTAFNIAQWSKKTEAEVLEALRVLSSPDKRRLEPQPYEGRRIERVAEGWLLLNGEFYQNLMREVNRKAYKARKEREYRQKRKPPVPKAENSEDLARVHDANAEMHLKHAAEIRAETESFDSAVPIGPADRGLAELKARLAQLRQERHSG